MSRKLAVVVPNLTDAHRQAIREAAERNQCEFRFLDTPREDLDFVLSSEIVFGHLPEIARTSPDLRWLATPYAGIDQFLVPDAFANPNALLTNSSGAYGVTIAEHIVMVLLAILRRDPEYRKIIAEKKWERSLAIRSIRGSRITLLGTGDIGREAARRLRAFAPASLIGINRSGKNPENLFDTVKTVAADGWEDVLPETDVLIVSLPGTREAYHLLGRDQLKKLPDGAVIINVGRGSVIDQSALLAELQSGRLSAGLDVFEEEPLPKDDPAWTLPNLFITPHTAGNMTLGYTVDRIVEIFIENLDRYCANQPLLHLTDRQRGY